MRKISNGRKIVRIAPISTTKRIVSARPIFGKFFERTKRTKRFRKIRKLVKKIGKQFTDHVRIETISTPSIEENYSDVLFGFHSLGPQMVIRTIDSQATPWPFWFKPFCFNLTLRLSGPHAIRIFLYFFS